MSSDRLFQWTKPDQGVSPEEAVFSALSKAEDRVSRLEERVKASGFAEGWRARADVRAVLGAMSVEGELVHPEDLILHDLGADRTAPDGSVTRARRLLQARRKAASGGPELLSWRGVAWLSGSAAQPPPPGQRPTAQVGPASAGRFAGLAAYFSALEKGSSESARIGVEEWLAVLDQQDLPSLLLAAALMEAWRIVDPMPRQRSIGALAFAIFLRSSRRFEAGLFPLEVGVRRRPIPSRLPWAPLHDRLAYWLDVIAVAADQELEELTRLGHQKAQIERKAQGSRRTSRAGDLARLAVSRPVVTTELIARELGITPQASLQLIRRLDGVLHELTGRSRYRVWRL